MRWRHRWTEEEKAILRRSRVVGWGPFPLPGEKRRQIAAYRQTKLLLESLDQMRNGQKIRAEKEE